MKYSEIFYFLFRIIKWKFRDRSPAVASLKITYRCNLSCLHCPWVKMKSKEIDIDKWKSIIDELYLEGVRVVVMEGGEPTLYKGLNELVSYTKSKQMKTIVVTNGINYKDNLNPDLFMVSIDGPKEQHDQIRGVGSFEKTLTTLNKYTQRKLALTTINKVNYKKITSLVNNIDSYVDGFAFTLMFSYNSSENIGLNKEQARDVYKELSLLSDKYKVFNDKKTLHTNEWECRPWLLKMVEPLGNITSDCFVEYAQNKPECSRCFLSCHKDIVELSKGNINAWYKANKYLFGSREI